VPCPFCSLADTALVYESDLVVAFRDRFPVSNGHTLVVPRRHVPTYFDANAFEQAELWRAVEVVKRALDEELHPDGYNVGFNAGEAAGQTVMHLHLHVIPRFRGDMDDPRGGVRGVIPEKRVYMLSEKPAPGYQRGSKQGSVADRVLAGARHALNFPELAVAPHLNSLISGAESDPLLPHLRAHLANAAEVDIAVAFVLSRGLELVIDLLERLLERGGHLRLLTGDYLGGTEPDALRRLYDLMVTFPDRAAVRVYETRARSFHPKAYLIVGRDGAGTALVGSSNLSHMALKRGVEWSYRVAPTDDSEAAIVRQTFNTLFHDPATVELSPDWINDYAARRPNLVPRKPETGGDSTDPTPVEPEPIDEVRPTPIQQTALNALQDTRADGNRAGLVVLATGLGKTWLAAFDSSSLGYGRVLFVAHREEILRQAFRTFRRVRPEATLGFYNGLEKQPEADVLFASVQALSQQQHLRKFARDHFDYMVVDEFHHADAVTYRTLLDYFEPQFLLGLTATPDRTDGGDLLALCGENLIHSVDLFEGIQEGELAPFDYFGVPDDVSYENIPWRRLTEAQLTELVATTARNENALAQLRKRGGRRILAFCVSISHAELTKRFFADNGYRVVTVHSAEGSAPRVESVEQLQSGELDMIVTVDVFNEGVDIPAVDTVLMLRPTESRIVWLQQLGRGLRRHGQHKRLKVIDYVGNHRIFVRHLETLMQLQDARSSAARLAIGQLRESGGVQELPGGCTVTYELEALDNLERAIGTSRKEDAFEDWANGFVALHGRRPHAVESYHAGFDPPALPSKLKPFFVGLRQLDLLSEPEAQVLSKAMCAELLRVVQVTAMERSYKMVLLLGWIAHADFPIPVQLSTLADAFSRVARRNGPLALDVSVSLDHAREVERLLEKNPIAAWTGSGSGGNELFEFEASTLSVRHDAPPELASTFTDMVRELAEWRLAAYLHRNRQKRISQVVDHQGQELDARFTTETTDLGFAVILESRGGTAGSKAARNTQYAEGLRVLLDRLKELGSTITGAEFATRQVSGEALTLKRFAFPVSMSSVASTDELRKELQAAQGNNPTRRIRLLVSGMEMDLRMFHRTLASGSRPGPPS